MLLFNETLDMLFSLLNIVRGASDLDIRAILALAGNIDDNAKLGLDIASGLAATANQGSVLILRDVDNLGNLTGALINKGLNQLCNSLDK